MRAKDILQAMNDVDQNLIGQYIQNPKQDLIVQILFGNKEKRCYLYYLH